MNARYYALTMLVFIALSLIMNSATLGKPGYVQFYDRTENIDLTSFRAYFTSLYKWDQVVDLDITKRIFSEWVFFLIDEQQLDAVRFPLQSFLILAVSFHVLLRFIEVEKYRVGEEEKHLIAATGAFFYLVNPVAIEHYISLYPEFSYAIFPAAIYSMYMTFRSMDLKYPLLLGLVSSILVGLVIHNALYLAVSAACAAVVALACMKSPPADIARKAAIAGGAFAALSMFMILPVAYTSLADKLPNPGYINAIEDVLSNSRDADMFRVMLQDVNLNANASVHFSYPLGALYYPAMAILTAAVLSAAIYYRSALSAFAGLAFAGFALLANGINSPIGGAYLFAVLELPMGWLIRGSPKFVFIMPFFFALMLVHALCTLRASKRLIAAFCLAVILNQSVFCNIVWDGSYGGAAFKKLPEGGIMGAIDFLRGENVSGKVGWYGDYVRSAPTDVWVPVGRSQNALAFLVGNPDPAGSVSIMSDALGMEYVMIDEKNRKPYYYFGYAKGSGDDLGKEFETAYEGDGVRVFRTGANASPFYIPKVSMLSYAGYGVISGISQEAAIGRDIALVMADDEPGLAGSAANFTDAVVLDSRSALPYSLDGGRVITFGKNISGRDGRRGWSKSTANSNIFITDWPRVLERYRIAGEDNDYGLGLVYTDANFSLWKPLEEKAFIESGRFSFSGTGEAARAGGNGTIELDLKKIPAGNFTAFEFTGRAVPAGLSGYRIDAYFLNKGGSAIGHAELASGNRSKEFNRTIEVPARAAYVQLRAIGVTETSSGDIALENVAIRGRNYGPNVLEEEFSLPDEGEYDLYLRVFASPDGGNVSISVNNGTESSMNTLSDTAGFEWRRVYGGKLGRHNTIRLVNNGGLNAVNIGYAARGGEESVLPGKGILYVFEAEKDFAAEGAKFEKTKGASGGIDAMLKKTSKMRATLHVYDSREYSISAGGRNVSVFIDGKKVNGSTFLEKGDHTLSVKAETDKARFDYLLAMDSRMGEIFRGLSDGSIIAGGQVAGYKRTGAAGYEVTVNASRPSLLVSTTGYEPLFGAMDGGGNIRPVSVYSTLNAFPLKPGARTLWVGYAPQGYMDAGLGISLLALFAIFGYLAWRWKNG
ncbi:MAG TPA: hypothetical protein VLD37_06620 [Candidatus Bilamarchaeum sp.]|nr:hypothetical protein [Candidatus Bilamarchaeum sp.]